MIKTEQREIGKRGYTYLVEQLGASAGSRLLLRIGKMLGKPLGDAIAGGVQMGPDAVGRVVATLSESVNEADFDHVCKQFISRTRVSGGEFGTKAPKMDDGMFDLHFAGQYAEMLEWLLFCMEVNFASFFAEAGAKLPAVLRDSELPLQAPASPSPNTSASSGTSGA